MKTWEECIKEVERESKAEPVDPMTYVFPLWTFIVGFVFGCYFGFVVM